MTTTQLTWDEIFAPAPAPTAEERAAMRKQYSSAKRWVEYLKSGWPELDWSEEKELKLQEDREKRMVSCGRMYQGEFNPKTMRHEMRIQFCKVKGCPRCDARRKEQNQSRVDNLFGKTMVVVDASEEDSFKSDLTKDDYMRVVRSDGKVAFILNKPHEGGVTIDWQAGRKLVDDMQDAQGRITGNLGKKPVAVESDNHEAEIDPNIFLDEFKEEIKVRKHQITFTPESTLHSIAEIDREVWRRMECDPDKQTADNLQFIVYQFEELCKAVCEEHKVEFLFLYTDTKKVEIKAAQWDNIRKQQDEAG